MSRPTQHNWGAVEPIDIAFIGRGLYRLYAENEQGELIVVYVGQSHCISGRIHAHRSQGRKTFSHFDYVLLPHVTQAELDLAEAEEIFRLGPIFNVTLPPTGAHKRLTQIAHILKVRPIKLQRYVEKNGLRSFLGKYAVSDFEGVPNESFV